MLARPVKPVLRSLAAVVMLASAVVGCGKGSDSASGGSKSSASARIDAVNKTMRETSFTATGTTTAFVGATQKTFWDPKQGYRMEVGGTPETEGGRMYCKDGTSYTSTRLFAAMLAQKGQQITVPDRLADRYISSDTGQDCSFYFAISSEGQFAPDKDATVDGKKALAVQVSAGLGEDVYFVSAESPDYLLKQEAARDGRVSSTMYTDFGAKMTISMPSDGQTMTMDEFRSAIGVG
ncbi:hypothetical protein ACFYYY_18060 [Streptomyces sp. NPDC001834]|uniref:hypothetical protein n=1 Tax=Streptomyces sp. NPDC001834 TaxID=3364616 RepID=UPI0036CCBC5E